MGGAFGDGHHGEHCTSCASAPATEVTLRERTAFCESERQGRGPPAGAAAALVFKLNPLELSDDSFVIRAVERQGPLSEDVDPAEGAERPAIYLLSLPETDTRGLGFLDDEGNLRTTDPEIKVERRTDGPVPDRAKNVESGIYGAPYVFRRQMLVAGTDELAFTLEDGLLTYEVAPDQVIRVENNPLFPERGGADVNARDYRSFTPLHPSAEVGAGAIVDLLVHQGAKASTLNAFKETPLHSIAKGGGTSDDKTKARIVDRLVEAGADVDATGNAARTPLYYAAARGNVKVVKALLAHGAQRVRRSVRLRPPGSVATARLKTHS